MLNFLGFILLLFLVFIIGIAAFAGMIMRKLFGAAGNRQSASENREKPGFSGRSNTKKHSEQETGRKNGKKKKIFTQDEGTYVDFVEVKD